MISLSNSYPPFITFTAIILYTCLYLPYLQIKNSLLSVVGKRSLVSDGDYRHEFFPDLPEARFGDLKHEEGADDEMCSICLMEFEKFDSVSQLGRCGHVFHVGCIHSWLDRNNFTCPLCRTSFLHSEQNGSMCKTLRASY